MPNNLHTTCDPDRIEAFLQQQLSAAEQTDFEAHLDQCDDCRERLEASAASDELWAGVRESLSAEPLSVELNDSAASDRAEFSYQTILDWLAPTDDDRMLGRLDAYEVMGVVGSGGMGVVLKALDPALNRYVAVKVLAPYLGSSGSARRRFSREARASAAVVHENVIEIHGVSEKDGLPYLVMPYVSGPSLQRRLDHEGPLELAEILRIGRQAATGLAAAHAQGLVHRDVKPANILLAEGVERVKLTDFGLARAADDASLTKSGVIAGTPQYMSPEQARGETIDQRSDLFSLGSVLYAMCTGRAPFRAETSYGVLRRITDDEPRPIREINPGIPEWLCEITSKLMSKDADDRFQSAHEVAELLEQCLAHVQQPTVVPLPASLVPQPKSRFFSNLRRPRLITAFGLVGMGILAVLFWQSSAPPDISGKWQGKQWGNVTLKQLKAGKYEGTYTDVFQSSYENPHPEKWGNNCLVCHKGVDALGTIELKWSRLDQRYRGSWALGKQRFGRMSVEVADGEIRGFWDVNKKSKINPGTPEREAPLVWVRRTEDSTTGTRNHTFESRTGDYKQLIERRRYNDAAALALRAKQLASDEDARQLWELRSKFANQLIDARGNSDEEQKLLTLMDISLQRITESYNPHTSSPPQPIEVVRAVEQSEKVPENSLTGLFKQHPDNIRIIVEPVYDKVEKPRFYPLVGVARLHRLRFKCTLFFTESDDLKWPGPDQGKGRIEKTTYIDHDHLIGVAKETESTEETPRPSAEESSSSNGRVPANLSDETKNEFYSVLPLMGWTVLGIPDSDPEAKRFHSYLKNNDWIRYQDFTKYLQIDPSESRVIEPGAMTAWVLLSGPRASRVSSLKEQEHDVGLPEPFLTVTGHRSDLVLTSVARGNQDKLFLRVDVSPFNDVTQDFWQEHPLVLRITQDMWQQAARGETVCQIVSLGDDSKSLARRFIDDAKSGEPAEADRLALIQITNQPAAQDSSPDKAAVTDPRKPDESRQAQQTAHGADSLPWQDVSEEALMQALRQKKTVLIDFSADWCPTCKQNERVALNTQNTLEWVTAHDVVTLYADYTSKSPSLKGWLNKFGSSGVPLTVIYPGENPTGPFVLQGTFSESTLLEKLEETAKTTIRAEGDPRKNSLKQLPEGLSNEARFCLLTFAERGEQTVWIIQDRDLLYVDLNGDGDLSAADEQFVEKEEQGFAVPGVASRGFVIPPTLQSNPRLRGYFPMRISWQRSGDQNLWVRLLVKDKYWQEAIIPASSTKPEAAPILHFDGPLRYFLLHPKSEFKVTGKPLSLSVAAGTVSATGDIVYADFDDRPLDGTFHPELTARYVATDDSEVRKLETSGLMADQYGGYFIATLKGTNELQPGTIEIEVASPEGSPLEVAPLKCRLPLKLTTSR